MFLPPETWLQRKFKGKPVDIWALGITFYFLTVGRYPFNCTDMSKFNKIVETQEIKFPDRVNPQLKDLLQKMIHKDPSSRITLPEMMQHPFITSNGMHPMEAISNTKLITVTKNDIQNAMTISRLEVNLFALSKMKTNLSRQRTRNSGKKVNLHSGGHRGSKHLTVNPVGGGKSLFSSISKIGKKSNDKFKTGINLDEDDF